MRFPSFFTLGLIAASWLCSNSIAHAQLTGISIESVLTHDASIDPSLDGYTTYRVYADLSSSTDFVSAVFGDAANPLVLGCTGTIYQSFGVNFNYAVEVNPLFFSAFPTAEYDSWFTIGAEDANGGVNVQNTADTMQPALAAFNAGEGFVIDDPIGASWFNVFPCAAGADIAQCADGYPAFGGADSRVLIAQITATGDVYGIVNVQVFPGGMQVDQQQAVGFTFSTNEADVFGCTDWAATNYNPSATVDDLSCIFPCVLALELNNVVAPSCNGQNDAFIQVTSVGAQGADYFYRDTIAGTPQNFGNFGNLIAGVYTIYVVDAAGCVASLDVEVPVTEVVEIAAELTSGVSCNGESDAVVSIAETTGGSGEYEYYISNNPTVFTTQTEWTGLAGGQTVSIYAIDSNGCIGQSNAVGITDPTPISVGFQVDENASVIDASCANIADGQIYVTAFGGAAPLTLQFSVDGENYAPSPLMVPGGTYTVTAQDVNGCIGTMATEVVVGPEAINVNPMSMPELCVGSEDGAVSWAPEGGEGGYSYVFNGEAMEATSVGDLAPGTYAVTVTDDSGCSETASVVVEPAVEIQTFVEVADALCFGEGGEAVVYAEGGTDGFQFSDDGNNYSQGSFFDELLAGVYTFFVQDENGCVESVEVSVSEPDAVVLTAIVSAGSLDGEGTIDVSVTGGSLPYSYEWIGPGVSGQDGQDLEGISTGTYLVEVTDANGCTVTETFSIVTSSLGCTDSTACNYEPNASIDDGSCDYSCFGCTDAEAFNYNPEATIDDGSCVFFVPECASVGEEGWASLSTGIYPQGLIEREFGVPTSVNLVLHVATLIEEPSSGQLFAVNSFVPEAVLGLPAGMVATGEWSALGPNEQLCLEWAGTPAQEGVFNVDIVGELTISVFGTPYSIGSYSFTQTLFITPNVNGIPGCMYVFASNYNAIATYDDNSCFIAGCMDASACNYNSFASVDSGDCTFACLGCTYPEAGNFEPTATLDDGSCEFVGDGSCIFDTNGDQYVGSEDLLNFLSAFGTTCP